MPKYAHHPAADSTNVLHDAAVRFPLSARTHECHPPGNFLKPRRQYSPTPRPWSENQTYPAKVSTKGCGATATRGIVLYHDVFTMMATSPFALFSSFFLDRACISLRMCAKQIRHQNKNSLPHVVLGNGPKESKETFCPGLLGNGNETRGHLPKLASPTPSSPFQPSQSAIDTL